MGGLWPEPHPLQGPSSSPSTKLQPILRGQQKGPSNTRGLEDLKTQVAPEQRPFSHTQSEAAFVSKRRRAWARERSLLAAPGEELLGSEGTFQSLRCIDKLRPTGPVGDLGPEGAAAAGGGVGGGGPPKQANHKVKAGAGLPQTGQKRIPRSPGRSRELEAGLGGGQLLGSVMKLEDGKGSPE